MRAYVFVDAENHFIRSTAAAEDVIGTPKAAKALSKAKNTQQLSVSVGFPVAIDGNRFGWKPDLQLFWDCEVLSSGGNLARLDARVSRAVYACS